MQRSIATIVLAATLGSVLPTTNARADRPKEQADPPPPPEPPPPPPPAPPPPPVTPPPPVYVPAPPPAPAVTAKGEVVVMPGAPPSPGGTVITPQGVPIVIRNSVAGIEHRLVTVDGMVLGSCMGNCTFQVPPGSYYVESGETDDLRSGRKKLIVTGPTLVDIDPGSKSQRTTGLVLGITGPVLFFVGMFGTVIVAAQRSSIETDCDFSGRRCGESKPDYTPWVLSLVAGLGATTAGWIMFGTSGTKMKASGYAPPVSVSPTVGAGTVGLTVSF